MPCYITGSAEGDLRLDHEEMRNQLTQVTQLLCELCNSTKPSKMTPKLRTWWREHDSRDGAFRPAKTESVYDTGVEPVYMWVVSGYTESSDKFIYVFEREQAHSKIEDFLAREMPDEYRDVGFVNWRMTKEQVR